MIDKPSDNWASRTWGAVDLCKIPFSEKNTHNARCGEEAHITGFHHATNFYNLLNVPVKVYEYWVIPLNYRSGLMGDSDLQDDFYTIHGEERDTDVGWTNDRPSYLYDEPINSNKYSVLKKKVTNLAPAGSGGFFNKTNTYVSSKRFIKLNRKFTYGTAEYEGTVGDGLTATFGDTGEGFFPEQPSVFYISFAIPVMEGVNSPPIDECVRREMHVITYFRDTSSGL
jgi:hypothetical protein